MSAILYSGGRDQEDLNYIVRLSQKKKKKHTHTQKNKLSWGCSSVIRTYSQSPAQKNKIKLVPLNIYKSYISGSVSCIYYLESYFEEKPSISQHT
jgi:hypothetical protein